MSLVTPPRRTIEAGKLSPVVKNTSLRRRYLFNRSKKLVWAAINFLTAILLFYELNVKLLQSLFGINGTFLYYVLLLSAVIFMSNAVIDFVQAAQLSFASPNYALSLIQRQLMGIKKTDMNFLNVAATTPSQNEVLSRPPTLFSLSNLTKNQHTSTPKNERSNPHPPSPSSSFHTSFETPKNSLVQNSGGSPMFDLNKSERVWNSSIDSFGGNSFLRNRKYGGLPLSPEQYMTDQKTLNTYLKSCYFKQQSKICSNNSSLWNQTMLESSAELSKNQYQISSMSPKSQITSKTKDNSAKIAAAEYWKQADVNSDTLRHWMANLRRWISVTILSGLVKEIDDINESLIKIGCNEVQIGESSLSTIKMIQQLKTNQIQKLSLIVPYLEVTPHQEYLVSRLRILSSGGYMSEFSWDKGGCQENSKWGEELITDSSLIMHLLCVYMDQHLPPHPRFPDGTTFTSQHFAAVKSQALDAPNSGYPLIFQSKLHPPHYKLITSDSVYDLPPGRYNMLCTLLLFLHLVKIKNSGMMGHVNLGLSGINILCVIDDVISSWKTHI